ncbi:MAG TPA: PAS domain-containing sensor histidine kinase [Gaiellaceae bacterium]|nr:PAS domain-containing sensor histidine kinase [Gaiellaceae bacterium]
MTATDEADHVRDHEALRSMHAAAQADADRYRALFDAAPTALLVTGHNLTIVECNAACARLLGVDERFLVGKPLTVYVDLGSRRLLRPRGGTLHHRTTRMSLRMRRRSGVAFDAAVAATPTPREIYWSISDRTEEAQAEARLWELNRELEHRIDQQSRELETLAARLPVGVIVLRAGGEIAWANARAYEIFGGPPDAVAPHLAEPFQGREIRDVRATMWRDRREIVVELTAAPLGGRSGGIVVVVDDVTQRDRLERADAEFVQNAAHQLRNPITAIASSVAALNAGARDDPAERDRFLDHIGRDAERIGSLVEALLALAALQRGDVAPRIEVVPLYGLLEDAVGAAPPGSHIEIDCPAEIAVVADGALLTQAVGNVVANAVEHARSEVRVEAHVEEATAVVEVRDDGPGIPAGARDLIFERFFRVHESGRRGSGLGLAIASAAAEAAQSTLELLPANGSGAAFRFTIPGARLL